MPQMTEATLINELETMTNDATGNNSTFTRQNEFLLQRYMAEPYGDERPEGSSVVSNDVMDVVEADMPSLARIFLGTGDILKFKPNTKKEDDVKEAEDKTKYVNWQIRCQPWSFSVLHGFIKNAEIEKTSVVKYFIEESTKVEEHKKTGLSDEELTLFIESLKGKDVKGEPEIVRQEKGDTEENTVVVKVEKTTKTTKIVGVPLETFRMTKNAVDKDSADCVGDVSVMKRSDLMAQGYSKDVVSKIPKHGITSQGDASSTTASNLPDIRNRDEGGTDDQSDISDWANEDILVSDLYPLIDYDGDGVAERRHIMLGGTDVILENEVFNHVPYAVMSAILMPHKAIGMSRAEITAPTAKSKTYILRGVNENISAVNKPRIAANRNVNMDDLLVVRENGVIRTTDKSNPGQNMFPVEVPYIGDKALQVLQYWDQARAQTTGSLMASQGLNADDLGKETATRFEGVQDASGAKVELVARVMAETGFRQLYEGVAWLDANYQNSEVEIEVLGHELRVNPADWQYEHSVVSKVGLGAGDDDQKLQTLSGLWVMHKELQATGSPMTDEVKRYNIAKGIVAASGEPEVSEFFNDPAQPEELIKAQNEILTNLVQQLQEQLQQMANPLAEAETIKAQAGLIQAQAKQELNIAQLQEDQRQFNIQTAQKQDQFMKDLAATLTELELKFNTPVKGAING